MTVDELAQMNKVHAQNKEGESELEKGVTEYTRDNLPEDVNEGLNRSVNNSIGGEVNSSIRAEDVPLEIANDVDDVDEDEDEEMYETIPDAIPPTNVRPLPRRNKRKREEDSAQYEPSSKQRAVEPEYLSNVLHQETRTKMYRCRYCNSKFQRRNSLRRHINTFHVSDLTKVKKKVRNFPSWTRAVKIKNWLDDNTEVGSKRLQVKAPKYKIQPKFRAKFKKWK